MNTMLTIPMSSVRSLPRVILSRVCSTQSGPSSSIRREEAKTNHPDAPSFDMENPFRKEKPQCILCKYSVELDYKNTRLLSQFMSTFTGRVYDKHITGLCEKQQQKLKREVEKARKCYLMPIIHKNVKFVHDPPLFDPFKPQRPHPY